ncbi:hypothetical protein PHMEG_00035809, partial [Phytophthora megakarya]
ILNMAHSRLLRGRVSPIASILHSSPPRILVNTSSLRCNFQRIRLFSSTSEVENSNVTKSSNEWENVVKPAYLTFLQLEKHLIVPIAFTVPHGNKSWPEATWGYRLGKHAEKLRKDWRQGVPIDSRHKKELDEMPFAWDLNRYKWDHFGLPALRRFRDLNGHLSVPYDFRIPSDTSQWPEHLWGQCLGSKVHNMRNNGKRDMQRVRDKKVLDEMGFVWDCKETEWSERILPALEMYRQLKRDCRIPYNFVVPQHDSWPRKLWNLGLGSIVNQIRHKDTYRTQVSRDSLRLKEIDFVYDFYDANWNERIFPALEAFYREHGHTRVPQTFQVPPDKSWPKNAHGLKLGRTVANIRKRGDYFDFVARSLDSLETIEFYFKVPVFQWKNRVEPLLATFELVHGHRDVPLEFVIPSSDPWEEKDWGIALGKLEPRKRD